MPIKDPTSVVKDFFIGLAVDDLKKLGSRKSELIDKLLKVTDSAASFFKALGLSLEFITSAGHVITDINIQIGFRCCACVDKQSDWIPLVVGSQTNVGFVFLKQKEHLKKLPSIYYSAMFNAAQRMIKMFKSKQ